SRPELFHPEHVVCARRRTPIPDPHWPHSARHRPPAEYWTAAVGAAAEPGLAPQPSHGAERVFRPRRSHIRVHRWQESARGRRLPRGGLVVSPLDWRTILNAGRQPSRVRTWAKWIGRGLLGLLALVLVVIAAGYIFLTSRAGEERVLRLAVASARDAFQGSLEAEQLDFRGNHLVLHNVVLRDPDGGLIAQVDTLEVRLSLRTLFRRTIYVQQLTLIAPRVHLRFDDRGFNVARAFQPRNPSPPEPSAESTNPPTLGIVLESFQLRAGAVDLEQISEGSKRELRFEDLEARASGGYVSPSQKVKVDLQLDGRVTYPTPGPLSLKVREQGSGDHQAAQLALIWAGLRVDASAALAGDELQAQLARLEVPPKLVSAWVPGYPLLVPISASGEGALSGDVAAAKLELKAGSAAVLVEGSLDIAKLQSKGIALQARHINLRELLANGPDSNLEVNVQGRGGGHSVDTLDGR